jgi:ATP-binding cassette subfamily B protein
MQQFHAVRLLTFLWKSFSSRRKVQLALLLLLQILSSVAEMVSVGALVPFLAAILYPNDIQNNKYAQYLFRHLNDAASSDPIFYLTVFVFFAILISSAIRMLQIWVGARLAFSVGNEMSLKLYSNILSQPYLFHTHKNTSELIDLVLNKSTSVIYDGLLPCITIMSSFLTIFGIVSVLYFIDSRVTTFILIFGAALYIGLISVASKKLAQNGEIVNKQSINLIKSLQEGFGSIRHILIDQKHEYYCKIFNQTDLKLRKAQASTYFIGIIPRNIVEAVGLVVMVLMVYFSSNITNSSLVTIPVLGAIALGLQKIMPLMHQIYHSYSSIRSGQNSLEGAVQTLRASKQMELKQKKTTSIKFEKSIEFINVSFRYQEGSPIIVENFNCVIKKGYKVGVIGETGSGKSTLIDMLLGLLTPTTGMIVVDGLILNENNISIWQSKMSQVDQAVYLIDDSIKNNICFAEDPQFMSNSKMDKAIQLAGLENVVNSLPLRDEYKIGEKGGLLSGGQRQRIGIARALYKNAEILVFDEATSALDDDTERLIMKSLDSLPKDITLIIISHKKSTLSNCDLIIEMNRNGKYKIIENKQ